MQQMTQGDFGTAIARRLPFGDNSWLIKGKPTIRDHHAHQYRGNAFRHRPANQPGVRAISRRVAFSDYAATLHDNKRAGFRHSRVFKKGGHGSGKLFLADDSVIHNH